MGQTDASGVKRGLTEELATRWPSLPFMAFGVWTAWSSLTYSGSLWLSDNEVNGFYLSLLFVISTMTFAVVFLGAMSRIVLSWDSAFWRPWALFLSFWLARTGWAFPVKQRLCLWSEPL